MTQPPVEEKTETLQPPVQRKQEKVIIKTQKHKQGQKTTILDEDGPSLVHLNKEIDELATDINIINEIEKDQADVLKVFVGDPDNELFKLKYESLYNSLKEGQENEQR